MRTQYGSGRASLPAPSITRQASGNINGQGNTYYFYIKGKNRVGYSSASAVRSLVIADNSNINISPTSFSTFGWEDWRSFIVTVATTDDFSTSKVIYKQNLYEQDQITPVSLTNVIISEDYVINGTGEIANQAEFPTVNVPNGYRVKLLSTSRVYEFVEDSALTVDNINVYASTGGQWVFVSSNSLTELSSTCNTELLEVDANSFEAAPLDSFMTTPVPIKYYIKNNTSQPLTVGELNLNQYVSDVSINPSFYIYIRGYLSHDTFSLDVTGIDGVNTNQLYPATKIRLSKPLPANSSLVIDVIPDVVTSSAILQGSYITLYPLLVPYTTIEEVKYWDEPMADIASLKSLSSIQYKDGQARLVRSTNRVYVYDSTSALSDNGDTVLNPNGNSGNGRWLASSPAILPGSVTQEQLSDEVLDLLDAKISTDTVTIGSPTTYSINLDSVTADYLIINAPVADVLNTPTVINSSATLQNNETKIILVELRQQSSVCSLHSSFIFPGGLTPVLSGNSKTDLIMISFVKDGSGTVKKRAFVLQRDI